jgi:hypothetical protein
MVNRFERWPLPNFPVIFQRMAKTGKIILQVVDGARQPFTGNAIVILGLTIYLKEFRCLNLY